MIAPLIWLSVVDIERFKIPDPAVVAFLLIAGVLLYLTGAKDFLVHGATGIIVAAILWVMGGIYFRRYGHEALGIGDAKIFGAASFLLGPTKLPELFLFASLGGILATLLVRLLRRDFLEGVPFGPFIAFAGYVLSFIEPMFILGI